MKADYKLICALLTIIAVIAGILWFVSKADIGPISASDTLSAGGEAAPGKNNIDTLIPRKPHLQPFDPNTATEKQLHDLGLNDFLVKSILKYRLRGGAFTTPESFARVPGLTKRQYKELLPYIRIADDFRPAAELVPTRDYDRFGTPRDTVVYPIKLRPNERVMLNDADTNLLKRVPGIGSYYARKIVELRERYGGYVSLDQLKDIRGLPAGSYQYFSIPDGGITKININKADFATLQRHPYIGYNRAREISDYRRLKGAISSLEQLALLPGFGEEERRRLEPYIEY
ncbi:MAG: helix-hairpin-helix domain-containing protein [Prevotella sp.]|nr:helix-hairpin-helix domain-containing protein [Prevotella sp.]